MSNLSPTIESPKGDTFSTGQSIDATHRENKWYSDHRMHWFRDAKVGIFVHYGLYSLAGGVWDGVEIPGMAEHIRSGAKIPRDEYRKLAKDFTADSFDADKWAALFQRSGARYTVFTSKHHDGFCLFDTKKTQFKVTKSACGRDLMKEFAEAIRSAGLKLGWYYSPRDWDHPNFGPSLDFEAERSKEVDLNRYFSFMQDQVLELIHHYGPVSLLWFDGSDHPPQVANTDALKSKIRSVAPELIINDRIGKDGYLADFAINEGHIPGSAEPRDWETCLTLNYNWGYRHSDQRWVPVKELLEKLIDVVSKGGNFLVNVGPEGSGKIPEAVVQRLEAMGDWLSVNGCAIYGSRSYPVVSANENIRFTQRGSSVFVHLFNPPEEEFILKDVQLSARGRIRLLGHGICYSQPTPEGLLVRFPAPLKTSLPVVLQCDGVSSQA
jgi:alpha-L-fucosidase